MNDADIFLNYLYVRFDVYVLYVIHSLTQYLPYSQGRHYFLN